MLLKKIKTEMLETSIFETRAEMGVAAAQAAAIAIRAVLEEKGYANVIFAAAPSQNEMLEALSEQQIDFTRIHAFHMDEYEGLSIREEQSFARYLHDHIFSLAPFASVHYIPAHKGAEAACAEYTQLLNNNPPDVVCMGIGENGHIAFNDPPVADFNDPEVIKRVQLDEICRMQQVHDGCFPDLNAVPQYALTLTVPALMSARYLICTVPSASKANAVKSMLEGPYGESCPATALRKHNGAKVFLDADSGKKVME